MAIEKKINELAKELRRNDLKIMDKNKIFSSRDFIISEFNNTSFELEETKPHFSKYFKSLIKYNTKLKSIEIQIAEDKIEYEIKDGKKVIPKAAQEKDIESPSFIVNTNNFELRLKPLIKDGKIVDYRFFALVEKNFEMFYYLISNNEIKEIKLTTNKRIEVFISYNKKLNQYVKATFGSKYKNLLIFDDMNKEIGFGVMDYTVGINYYDIILHPVILYYKGKIRDKIEFKLLDRINKKRKIYNTVRVDTLKEHFIESFGEAHLKEDCYNIKSTNINLQDLKEMLSMAELKYTN